MKKVIKYTGLGIIVFLLLTYLNSSLIIKNVYSTQSYKYEKFENSVKGKQKFPVRTYLTSLKFLIPSAGKNYNQTISVFTPFKIKEHETPLHSYCIIYPEIENPALHFLTSVTGNRAPPIS